MSVGVPEHPDVSKRIVVENGSWTEVVKRFCRDPPSTPDTRPPRRHTTVNPLPEILEQGVGGVERGNGGDEKKSRHEGTDTPSGLAVVYILLYELVKRGIMRFS